jgi:NitT/TauT family transport system permease protein
MTRGAWQAWLALIAFSAAIALPAVFSAGQESYFLGMGGGAILVFLLLGFAVAAGLQREPNQAGDFVIFLGAHAGGIFALLLLPTVAAIASDRATSFAGLMHATPGFWGLVIASWLLAWLLVKRLSLVRPMTRSSATFMKVLVPLIFGLWLLFLWQVAVRGMGVPSVLLPAPSAIWARLTGSIPMLAADFRQTFLKAVIAGYAIGCLSGFLVALLVDRVPFLKRGLLPIGNLVSALPIIGIAPIMVMWFGFDWPSKAAVVVIMTFFPMLVNTVAGLTAADAMQRDLMRTYAADHRQTLVKLRLPAALPFIFNALKINSTLALIGAIVAEFFGTPIVGMGFRISTGVGRMAIDVVWAEIAVAALAGSVFYGVMALVERACTFWHPSFRT